MFQQRNDIRSTISSATHSSKTASCIVVAFKRHFDGLCILSECQALDVVQTYSLCPELSIKGRDANLWKVSLDIEIQFRLRLSRSHHEKNLRRLIDRKLLLSTGISLVVRDLAQDSFSSREIDKSKTDDRRDASGLADGTNHLLVSNCGRSRSPWSCSWSSIVSTACICKRSTAGWV